MELAEPVPSADGALSGSGGHADGAVCGLHPDWSESETEWCLELKQGARKRKRKKKREDS